MKDTNLESRVGLSEFSFDDRYDLEKHQVLLNGTQALVRLTLMQQARDVKSGLNTAGYVSGYRGSPLGAVDMQMSKAAAHLQKANVTFQAGFNEDIAATAIWGTQQAELRGEGKYDGVFGLWYGKGPGVDRSGDVMRHANFAGSSAHGGVVMVMGDDHTCESSTTLHQSEFAMVDAQMPIVSPAGVQEVLDYGLYGWALSRFSGLWVGLKAMKDTIEVTSIVDGDPDRMTFKTPDFPLPEGGLNIRLPDTPHDQEARLVNYKIAAAKAFARANRMDQRKLGVKGAKIGFVAAGKNWLDLQHSFQLLGIDDEAANRLGLTAYKVAQTWPLDDRSLRDWAEGLDLIVVVEEKRKLIEGQIKDALFDLPGCPRVYGGRKGGPDAPVLFPSTADFGPLLVAQNLGEILIEEGCATESIRTGLQKVQEASRTENAPDMAARVPYFCSGCPHNTSTKVPEGSRAYAGIGCHYLVQYMDRETQGYTHMGGEGANWIGESLFSNRAHVFQNIGDGTYNHSGIQTIRAAAMAGATMTYKILYNDAVAMTGGQGNDGGLTADQICRELLAIGVKHVDVVYDEKEDIDLDAFPKGVTLSERADLDAVQDKISKISGVSAIVYVQTCAAEKRRRRKRGTLPDPEKRILINPDICEGCGDCGVQSNCVAIVPVETELGRKRAIDQSACNKDFSCLKGFCPSFVTVEGGTPRKATSEDFVLPELPSPDLPRIDGTWNMVITGVGGTGAITIGACLVTAAHLETKGAAMMEMAGLAQKGGAVSIHVRLSEDPADITAIRVAAGEADAFLGCDLVTTATQKSRAMMKEGRSRAVINSHVTLTGDFTRDPSFRIPAEDLESALRQRLGDGVRFFDSTVLAEQLLGDSIYANTMTLGAAWQLGMVPLSAAALHRSIEMNGVAVKGNLRAFALGRWAVAFPEDMAKMLSANVVNLPQTLAAKIDFRADHLRRYQNRRLAKRYRAFVAQFDDPDVQEAVALGYHKLLAYKDEYEVARLLTQTHAQAAGAFTGELKLTYHLAPPHKSKPGSDGRPVKHAYGAGMARFFPLLARFKMLRGTALDPFGRTAERRMERRLITEYEADMALVLRAMRDDTRDAAIALARLPLDIRGFGPVKAANAAKAATRRQEFLTVLQANSLRIVAE